MIAIPLYAEDLIKELDKLYPERCPALCDTERQIMWYSGQRKLVQMLLISLEAQEKEKNKSIKEI